jgi:two-component system sensor histidine kinase UhpB
LRHAGCDHADLSLRVADGSLVLKVRDQGRGFDLDSAQANGVLGMHERALLVGARLELRSRPGDGTLVRLALPLQSGP